MTLNEWLSNLLNNQEPLGKDFEEAIFSDLESLYEYDNPDTQVNSTDAT